jgi:hypothetical protein
MIIFELGSVHVLSVGFKTGKIGIGLGRKINRV